MSHDHNTSTTQASEAANEASRVDDLDSLITAYELLEESIALREHHAWQIGAAVTLVWLAIALISGLAVLSWTFLPWSAGAAVCGLSLLATLGGLAWTFQAHRRRLAVKGFIDLEKGLRSQYMTAAHEYRAFLPITSPVAARAFDLRLARL